MASFKRGKSRKLNKQIKKKHGKMNIFNKGHVKNMRHDYESVRKNLRKTDSHLDDYC